jgi:hypothetical protein
MHAQQITRQCAIVINTGSVGNRRRLSRQLANPRSALTANQIPAVTASHMEATSIDHSASDPFATHFRPKLGIPQGHMAVLPVNQSGWIGNSMNHSFIPRQGTKTPPED